MKDFSCKEDSKEMKRLFGLFTAVCILLTGCSGIDSKLYDKLSEAIDFTLQQNGGMISLQSSSSEQDDMTLQFCYSYDENGIMNYCVEQTDKMGRRLFLEHNDGTVLQRWLLGHGTSSFDETSSDFVRYTRDNPYKYITLISSLPEKNCILELTAEPGDGQTVYTVREDPQKAAGEKDAQEELTSRMICYTVSDDGMISGYTQESIYSDQDGNQKQYTVTLTISQLGEISEVKLPAIE